MAAEWRQIPQLEHDMQVQDSDDFVCLGGHSVLVTLLAVWLTSEFPVDILVRHLLPASSFEGQVNLIRHLLTRPNVDDASNQREKGLRATLATEDLTELERQVWFQY